MGTVKVVFASPVQVHVRDPQGGLMDRLRDVAPGEPVEMDADEAKARIEQGNVKLYEEASPTPAPRTRPTPAPVEEPA